MSKSTFKTGGISITMIQVFFNILSYLFVGGVTLLGIDKMFSFSPPTLLDSVRNYVYFYEYVAWTIVAIATILLIFGDTIRKTKVPSPTFLFFLNSALHFNALIISVTILKDYSLGALFLWTLVITSSLRTQEVKN